MSDFLISATPTDPRARPLIEDLIHEYDSRYGDIFNRDGAQAELYRYPPEAFAPPSGNFLLLLRDGQTIGGGAFMRFDDTTAEFKRIWTRRDLRRQGLARRIVAALEDQAAAQGYTRVYLTTGFRQPEASTLYLPARGPSRASPHAPHPAPRQPSTRPPGAAWPASQHLDGPSSRGRPPSPG
ncbi:MAG: GNAT family N-acetyltransferase [Alphaproteobacteria bacterium HGW-Alphaproteobacteria-1]|jgi:GNAT superfamily N-acetyltransferase|nr:MAG: GNAT family N-acetyltransferase [Alphaproteobacteria bacterium HGW-Alphaproteobacteria-1]